MTRRIRPVRAGLPLLLGVLVSGVFAKNASAQRPAPEEPDTADIALLDELVVTADRAITPMTAAAAAVTRLDARALRIARFAGVAEALRVVPGFTLVDRDGSGLDPQPIVRGFYGGGEAEYVVVMLDGKPMNALHSGLTAWELIPPVSVEAVEVVRGSASSLYGDAALGGVVNFITAEGAESGGRLRLLGAGHGLLRGGLRVSGRLGGRAVRAHASGLRSDGFRDHGARQAADVGASYDLVSSERYALAVSLGTAWRTLERPGPLSTADLAADRTRSDLFYRFDETTERVHRVGLDGSVTIADGAELSARVGSEIRRSGDVRTLPLAPDFADTKERTLATERLAGAAQIVWDSLGLPWPGRLVTGFDGAWGRIDSEYRAVASGPRAAYASADGSRGATDASGRGSRLTGAAFAQLEVRPVPALRVTLGARYDRIRDRYRARPPSTTAEMDATHGALSPKVGASLQWLDTPTSIGSVYVAAGRSFKAATPDQLFDQRSIPLPSPPFSATTSNPMLVPQHGVSLEAGAYHAFALGPDRTHGTLSVSVYQMDMEDEIDFDLATLRYVNIGESRHRGLEAGARIAELGPVSGYASYTLQSARSRTGTYAGRSLKAIPRHAWSGGVSVAVTSRLDIGLDFTRASGAWLDDENRVALPAFTRLDARLTADVAGAAVFMEARNVLDARYSTTGFPDPAGSGTIHYYPASGRTLGLGIALGW